MTLTDLLTPFSDAVIVAVVEAAAPAAVDVIEAVVRPAGTVIVDSTGRVDELLCSATAVPPTGAGEVKITLIVTGWPLITDAVETARLERSGVLTVTTADFVVDPCVAVTVTALSAGTAAGVNAYIALVAPAGTVTLVPAGIAEPSELESAIFTPLAPALPVRVTVVETFVPP